MAKKDDIQRQQADAMREGFGEFFQDYYKNRRKIYWLNLVRGIWFGLGSAIGGTLVVAAILWLLSVLNQVPFLSDIVENVKRTLEQPPSGP